MPAAARELMPLGDSESSRLLPRESAAPPPAARRERGCSNRCALITGASTLAAILMVAGLSRGAGLSGRRSFSLETRYNLWKVKSENERLKEQLAAMERRLKDQQEKDMQRASSAVVREALSPAAKPEPAVAADRPSSPDAERLAIARRHRQAPPPPPDYRLSAERIRAHCDDHNIILITFVNSNRANYAYTWAAHVIRLKLTNYMVGAMDGEALVKLSARNITAFDMASGMGVEDFGWGGKAFRQLGLRKCALILTLLRAGADPILTDADALITRDPTPYVLRYARDADILVTSDNLRATAPDDGLEVPAAAVHAAWNIGYFYLKHTTLKALTHWQQECADHPTLWDQNLFKDVLKIGGLELPARGSEAEKKRLFRGYNRTLTIGILPVRTFCSGHTYFVQQMPQRAQPPQQPYSVHTTFQYSGAVGKIHRLREAMLWHEDGTEYLSPAKGLLVYTPVVRRELIRAKGVMDVASHFELVHHQLVQIRAAFLLARRLDRLLVLPRIVCGLDRFWAPHNGTIPGSDTTLPIDPCPADHVLDLERISGQLKGLDGLLREYSFLDNPRLPAELKAAIKQRVAPPASLDDTQLAPLKALASSRVLNLTHMPDLFRTLPADEQASEMRRMKEWTSIWCCSPPATKKGAGHVWYDLFFDIVPHTDRHRRDWTEPWKVQFGP